MSNGSERTPERTTLDGATTEPDPGVEPNVGEFAAVWNRKPEDERAEMLHNMRVWRNLGEQCWREDHEREITEQRSRIAALEATIAAAIAEATDRDSAADMLSMLELAPSTVLDQVIREAKAEGRKEALREAEDVVRAVEAVEVVGWANIPVDPEPFGEAVRALMEREF